MKKLSQDLRVGDFVNTSNGMREVLEIDDREMPYKRVVWVQDAASREGRTDIWYGPDYPVEVRG